MRYAFPFVLFSVLLLGAAAITGTDSSYVSLRTTTKTVTAGEQFSVDVYVYAHTPVNAIDLTISYPLSQAKVVGIDAGESVITLWTKDPYFQNNTVYLRGGTFREGFKGEHLIARIDAVAQKSGIADISVDSIRLLAGDGSGSEVAVAKDDGASDIKIFIANQNGEVVSDIAIIKIVTDIDGDGKVDLKDISVFMSAWHNRDVIFDFNGDGKMTFRDFGIILSDSFFK